MKKAKKLLRNLIIFIFLIILTFFVILKDQNVVDIISVLRDAKKEFIFIAIICMCFYIICDAINIRRTLNALKEKTTLLKSVKYSLIGFFFSGITPAASGGQPMQIYYMHKDNISVANSTLALLVNLTCIQIVTISIAFVSLLFNYQYLNNALIGFFILGIVLNSSALIILLISIFSKRMSKGLINIAIKILRFFRIKDLENRQIKLENELDKYHASANYIKNNKLVILKTLLTTYMQFILFYSISYWVYCSFGLSKNTIFEITTMQSVLYATVSGIPSPGAVGVSEGGFIAIYKAIFPKEILNSAMLLNRGINFYLFVLLSAIVVMVSTIKKKKHEIQITQKE